MIFTIVKPNSYMDSIFLMKATKELMKVEGVKDAVVVMGSDMNKTILADFGGLTEEAKAAGTNDLIISISSEDATCGEKTNDKIMELLTQKSSGEKKETTGEKVFSTIEEAKADCPDINFATIALPGEYAFLEAKRALLNNMNVFIFSDLTIEEEIKLKNIGAERNLLVMGPGAGTAIIDGVSIGVMSKVRRGRIGIAAASGSGLQEVAVLIHNMGLGVSQAIGTGGHDLSREVGGSMMLRAIKFFEEDDDTDVIVLVSKPPHPETCEKIYSLVKQSKKPVVIFFLGGDPESIKECGAYPAITLEEAARAACSFARGEKPSTEGRIKEAKKELAGLAEVERAKLNPRQKYLRGVFCGGTHSEETVVLLQDFLPNLHSNIKFGRSQLLENRFVSVENTLVDMGDEEFTKGRPHPVMDPTILCDRMLSEGKDKETAVILFDIILGHGVHLDPVGCIEETLREIRELCERENRYISIIASVCGTDLDPQNFKNQVERLEALGVRVMGSNSEAAILAGLVNARQEA